MTTFKRKFSLLKISSVDDFFSQFNAEKNAAIERRRRRRRSTLMSNSPSILRTFDLHNYNSYADIERILHALAANRPEMVTLLKIGSTFEGREIFGVKVSRKAFARMARAFLLLFARLQDQNRTKSSGRRSSSMPEFTRASLSRRQSRLCSLNISLCDTRNRRARARFSTPTTCEKTIFCFFFASCQTLLITCRFIVPVINADGYVWATTRDRLWRKTRSRKSNVSKWCIGADANRNFGYRWGGKFLVQR